MTQIERIEYYEKMLNEAAETLKELSSALDRYLAIQPHFDELAKYLESRQWRKDIADDEAGKFPGDLKRGVLSQDGIWNVLEEHKEIVNYITNEITHHNYK